MQTRDQIAERVTALIRAHFAHSGHRAQPGEIGDETAFADLGADSLDMLEIGLAAEDELDCEISDAEAEELRTVGQMVDLLAARQRAAA